MAERVLSARELNRALLARQLLLQPARLPVPRVLDRVAGIQAQYAPSTYIGLWTRMEGFEREALTRALERRAAVQGTLMRITIHAVSSRDYWLMAAAIRRGRRDHWLKTGRHDAGAAEMAALARRVRARLAGEVLRRDELMDLVRGSSMGDATAWNGVGLWVDLVRAPPSGTWERRRADVYALAEDWLGRSDATEEEGLAHLVRRYLGGFGPASPKEVANWAGLPASALSATVKRLRLRRFRDESGAELLDLPRAPLPDGDAPAPVRFLPTWDATLLAHARRTEILPERYRPLVFNTKTPHSVSTFLVDGQVAGTWRQNGERVVVEPFEPLPRAVRRELDEETERLSRFLR